jgi:glyoxylase-like metal-dependent hydrolase (beta-lactamase superfamily II)
VRRIAIIAALVGAGIVAHIGAQGGRTAKDLALPHRPTYAGTGTIEILPVQGSVYMLAGAGSNVTVQVGSDALFVVDTNEAAMSDKLLAAIATISPLPIRYIVNTSADADHVGGNERFATSSGTNVNAFLQQGARVYANENAYARMTNPKDGSSPMPTALWPTDAFAAPLKSLFVTGEPIEIIHRPAAHTDGDLMVFFRKSDVISSGDIFVTNSYPVLKAGQGGTLAGVLDGLNQLIDLAIPEFNSMGGTRVIPGHGRVANEIDLVEYRDAMTIVGDRVTQLVLEGKTADQVRSAGVTLDYDGVFGATTGPWTTQMFVDAVYQEVKANTATWRARLMRNVPADELPQLSTSAARPGARTAAARTPAATSARRASGNPLEGKWALNTFTSKYQPANSTPYRREMTLTFDGDEMTHAASTWRRIGNASPLSTVTYKAKIDGKEYTIPYTTSTVTLTRVDARTISRTLSGTDSGKETATWTLSPDGRTLTVVATGTDPTGVPYSSTQVYDKQP